MYLKRIKTFSANFALYSIEIVHDFDRVMDGNGRTLPEDILEGMTVGVSEINFCGRAKGRTGRHDLRAENTEIIYAEDLKKINGKYNVARWALLNQQELDELYHQRVVSSI